MKRRTSVTELTEGELRVLTRIARQMLECEGVEIHLTLSPQGGIRGYRENRTINPTDLPEGEAAILDALPKA